MRSSETWNYIPGKALHMGVDAAMPKGDRSAILIFMKDDFGMQLYIPSKEEQQASMCRIIASEMRCKNPELFDLTWLKVWKVQRGKTKAMIRRLKIFGV